MASTPSILWAQRPLCVYLTIDVQDVKGCKLDLNNLGEGDKQNGHLTFSGTSGEGTQYALDLQLYGSIDKEKSKVNVLPRHIFLVLEKSEAGSWPRLTKEAKGDHAHIKVDWDKWVDSDEEADDDFDLSGMGGFGDFSGGSDFSKMMANLGGGNPGADGAEDDSDDSHDEELPTLEATDTQQVPAA